MILSSSFQQVLNLLRISEEDDNIVNCVSLETGSWAADGEIQDVSLYTACNDHTVAEWTLCGRLKWRVTLPWCANHFAISPCKRLISIGADSRVSLFFVFVKVYAISTESRHVGSYDQKARSNT